MITDFNKTLGDLGVKQFVRNVVVGVFKEYVGKPEKVSECLDEVNSRLLSEFRKLASEEISNLTNDIKNMLDRKV